MPRERYWRAQVLQWMFWEQYEHEPALAVARFLKTYSGHPEWYEARKDGLLAKGYAALDAMERQLDGRTVFVGDALTLADLCLYAYTHAASEGGFELDRYPALRAWLDRVAAEPGHVPINA